MAMMYLAKGPGRGRKRKAAAVNILSCSWDNIDQGRLTYGYGIARFVCRAGAERYASAASQASYSRQAVRLDFFFFSNCFLI
jgi:hypothetical protein